MAYDRDSFLAGLAVGRTLWKPHTISLLPVPKYRFSYTLGWDSSFDYRIYMYATGLVVVDWGDGTSTEVEASTAGGMTTFLHSYASAGTFSVTIKIYDWANELRIGSLFSNGNGKYVRSLDSPLPSCVTRLEGFCVGGTNLQSIPSNLFAQVTNINNVTQAFASCGITDIPIGLFDNCPNLRSFDGCFANTPITSIPPGLFDYCTQATRFDSIFSGCGYLRSIPLGLFENCPSVSSFYEAFNGCGSIGSSVPELWVAYPSANGVRCFAGCVNAVNYADIPYNWR